MIDRHRKASRRVTLGAEEARDVADFIEQFRQRKVTPRVAVQDPPAKTGKRRKTKIDRRAIPADTISASVAASASRRSSAGPRSRPLGPRPGSRGNDGSRPGSSSPWPPTPSSGYPSSWEQARDQAPAPPKPHLARRQTAPNQPNRRDQTRIDRTHSRKTGRTRDPRQFFSSLLGPIARLCAARLLRDVAAVYRERDAGDVGGLVGTQEQRGGGDFLGAALAA